MNYFRTLGATARLFAALISLGCLSGCDSNYRDARVVKMAMIFVPENLAETDSCLELWNTFARLGIDMDNIRPDWNQVMIGSAQQLIEQGCVKDPKALKVRT